MPAFEVYKPDQAIRPRWFAGVSVISLVLFGCYQLYYALPEGAHGHAFAGFRPLGDEFPISWSLIVGVVTGLLGAGGTWWAVNHPKVVQFLADTEIEMTKVSWSSRREVLGSSIVVIATVVIIGLWVAGIDVFLVWTGKVFEGVLGGGQKPPVP